TTTVPTVPSVPNSAVVEEVLRTVRIDVGEMDTLLDGFAEVHAQLGNLRESLKQFTSIRSQLDLLSALLASQADPASPTQGRRSQYQQTRMTVDQLGAALDTLNRSLGSGIDHFDRDLTSVRDAAERMRLIRAGTLFSALERVARDAA